MNPLRGITLKIMSAVAFVVMASLVKQVSGTIPAGEAVFFRSLFAMPVIFIWLAMRGEVRGGIRTVRPMGHFFRGFAGTAAMGFGFAGLGLLPLPEVTAIGYASPLLTVVFAAMFLNETVGPFRIGMVLVGLVGVIIVLSPRLGVAGGDLTTAQMLGATVTLMGAVCGALAQVFVRKMVAVEKTSAIVFWFSFTSAVLSLATIPFGWAIPGPLTLCLLILTGLCGGIGQILLTSSYRHADASLIAPFEYSSMLFALMIGYFVFAEVPTAAMLIGAAIIIAAGIGIILRERYLGLNRADQRKSTTPQG
ncbi:DMT family transporter [Paracoccus pacificus]|uniref:DMT family transporter n=1 Tax=Paracoccus pacificus TaxID=1463598 RepID=A0ABW4R7T4_9RHOB